MPSMVVTSCPSACTAKTVQDLTASPSSHTVHAPQLDVSHPTWVPVRLSCSRRKWTSSVRGSTPVVCETPLTVTVTACFISAPSLRKGRTVTRLAAVPRGLQEGCGKFKTRCGTGVAGPLLGFAVVPRCGRARMPGVRFPPGADEDLLRQTARDREDLAPGRRRRQDARPAGDADCGCAPRQGQAPVHAARRLRRLRRGGERREGARDRRQAPAEEVLQ